MPEPAKPAPTTRLLRTGGRDYLVTDTVGFIRKLPHQLVDAFGATLEETKLADASEDEEERHTHERRAEKAEYLAEKLSEQEQAPDEE